MGVRVVGVCVLVYARTHTQTTWVLDVSPGVGRTPGGPEESRSTKAQYVLRVLMIWANCFFLLTCLFFLEK